MKYKKSLLIAAFGLLGCAPGVAQKLRVAAAANLQTVMNVLQADFTKKTGIGVEVITGSSGKLVAQISHGAPYDVFLSADMQFPGALHKSGLSTGAPAIYAAGSLIICTTKKMALNNWQQLLLNGSFKKIAIANPAIAPYGKAAQQALSHAGIYQHIQKKLVYGESIAQVNTYINTGVADAGFTTQSLIYDRGSKNKLYWHVIDPQVYSPIQQGMVILKRAEKNIEAKKFYQYILSPAAKLIFKKYGYKTA